MKLIRYIEYLLTKHRIRKELKEIFPEVDTKRVNKIIRTTFRLKKTLKQLSKN